MSQVLDGRRALVVGASAGIGREIGLRLSRLGADVVFHGRRVDRLKAAVETAGRGYAVAADLADEADCSRLVEESIAHLGALDLLVHAASVSRLALVSQLTAHDWREVYNTNVIAPALVVRASLPHLQPGAVCAFLSSESVGMPYHGLIPYASSKAALEEIVRGLRLEHPEFRFASIRVGQTTPTDFSRDFDLEVAADLFPKWVAHGRISSQAMDVVEVGTMIADSLAIASACPTVEMQDLTLRAPGGLLSSDPQSVVAGVADLQES